MFSLKTSFVAGEIKATDMPDRNIFHYQYKYQCFTKILMTEILVKTGNQAKKQVIFTRHPLIWPMDNRQWWMADRGKTHGSWITVRRKSRGYAWQTMSVE